MAKEETFVVLDDRMEKVLDVGKSEKDVLEDIAECMVEWETDSIFIAKVVKEVSLVVNVTDV